MARQVWIDRSTAEDLHTVFETYGTELPYSVELFIKEMAEEFGMGEPVFKGEVANGNS